MVLLSGGIDSATCLYLAKKTGYATRALTIAFHGIAQGEVIAAKAIAQRAEVKEHKLIRIPALRELGDIGTAVNLRGLPPTYIPLRNLIFYGLAASYAEEVGAGYIIGGHNRDDLPLFEDTRNRFFANLERTIRSASKRLRERNLTILRPVQRKTKVEVVRLAASLGVPFELTWSCHRGGRRHCWRCEGCTKRIDVFRRAGARDPLRSGNSRTNV